MLNKFTLHCHLHDLITNYWGCIVLCRHERFIPWGLSGCCVSYLCCLNQSPGKDYCPVAGSHLSVSWSTQFRWLVLVMLLWPAGQHITWDPLLEQRETGGNGQRDYGRTGQTKDKTLDSGGNQRKVEEVNVPSKIDYTLAAGIDMCQRSLLLQSCTNSHMVALGRSYTSDKLQLSLPSAELSYCLPPCKQMPLSPLIHVSLGFQNKETGIIFLVWAVFLFLCRP